MSQFKEVPIVRNSDRPSSSVNLRHARSAWMLASVLCASILTTLPASGQQTHVDLGLYLSRHGPGLHAGFGSAALSGYVRAEQWSTAVRTAGLRLRLAAPSDGNVYVAGMIGSGRCPSVLIGERGTGCDDEWHTLYGGALGLEVLNGRRGVVFAEVQRLHIADGSEDIPEWSFAVGYMLRLRSAP
jgi:hypothetical protein